LASDGLRERRTAFAGARSALKVCYKFGCPEENAVFAELVKKVVDGVDGGVGGLIMGLDGIAVETYISEGNYDVNTIGMEFSFILTQVKKAGDILQLGGVNEFSIKAESITIVMRMLTDEYFLAVVLRSDGNFGKCRFMMRLAQPQFVAEL
jgi:predicted regulator of Ras-like GTPase activity (Roadblock/LC7/MglB family)